MTTYEVIERVISSGDLSRMDAASRVAWYWKVCDSLGLNPLTQPFSFLVLDGKMTLYARKDATDQLRAINRVSVTGLRSELNSQLELLSVFAKGRTPDGREEEATGVVSVKGFSGQALANLWMKAETKAKRRLTLSLVGLGFLDESEVEGQGTPVQMDAQGNLSQPQSPAPASLLEQVQAQAAALAPEPAADEGTFTEMAAGGTVSAPGEVIVQAGETVAPLEAPEPVQPTLIPEEPAAAPPEEPAPPEAPAEAPILAAPMSVEESAAVTTETEEELLAEAAAAKPKGLTIGELADLARAASAGKRAFASAIDCVPADVSARIEAMTDAQRYALAAGMGLLGGGA